MPLETGQYLSDLNPNNPGVTDPASQGDDHLRFIKSVLKNTFPNVTGIVTGSHTELNDAVAVTNDGTSKLADAGAFFNTNNTDGFTNPAAGEVDVKAGGNVVVKLKDDKSAAFQGTVSSVGPITGPGVIPIGGSLVWWSDTLPDASFGTYAWCNGAPYLRSNTALFNVLGTKFGVGDGLTTANLPDLREAVPVGNSTMGATSARGIITNFASSIIAVLGSLFGESEHTLTKAEAPKGLYTFNDPGHNHAGAIQNKNGGAAQASPGNTGPWDLVRTSTDTTGITLTDNAGDGAHNNIQSSVICNWIIRTA